MRAIGINTGPATHLDHLGVLCILFGIPLAVTDERVYETARRFYPELDVHLCSWNDLSLDSLSEHADILLGCGKFWAETLLPALECVCKKRMRLVFCPHGNSDKGRNVKHPAQDISLYYGDHMLELLKTTGAASSIGHLVRTGNYRCQFYLDRRPFYDALADELVFLPKNKKTILYAPTWPNKENPSSVFELSSQIVEQLTPSFTLLVKWHPLLEEFYPGLTYQFLGRFEGRPGVHFISDFPAIYPLLNRVDGYLGDFSSIGYDFLYFDRPLYFLPPMGSNVFGPLFKCGITLAHNKFSEILEKTWEENQHGYHAARKDLYKHAFGEQRTIEQIKEEIYQVAKI